jgi:carbamoylphosphate synthase large subunit
MTTAASTTSASRRRSCRSGRFPGADVVLGPEMKSTGEVMGIANNFPAAYAKTQLAVMEAVKHGVTYVTTFAAAQAMVAAIEVARDSGLPVIALQDMPQWEG